MEDALFTSTTISGGMPDTTNMDFGMMDDLLLEGCWLETTDCSNLLQQGDITSATLLDSSCFSPASDICINSPYPNTPINGIDDTEKLGFSDASPIPGTQIESCAGVQTLYRNTAGGADSSGQSDSYLAEEGRNLDMINPSSEPARRWWIQPRADPDLASSVKERLVHVLNCIKESTKDSDVLVQIWVPIKKGGRKVLTTCGQPFSLSPHCQRLVNYRTVSTNYLFRAEEDSDMVAGLPGRVFLGRSPEWTPDVRYFSSEEFPRVDHAHRYDVRGTIGLPVFERDSQACLGVVEVVMTTQKVNYRPELENICSALQAVDLRTSEVSSISHLKANNNSYQVVIPEIQEIMRAVCEAHQLPLAQTWVPCIQQGKKGSRHTDENYAYCVSTIDGACFIVDPDIWGFHEACSEHHLFRGQGVVGKAFTSNQPCFSMDITAFSKTEYPLSHHARMFGLQAAVAVHLRSIYTGKTDFVLEFFLPVDCRNHEEQKLMLNSLSVIIQHFCRSLQVVTEKELDDENGFSVNKPISSDKLLGKSISDGRPNINKMAEVGFSPSTEASEEKSSSTSIVQQKGTNVLYPAGMPLEFQEQEANKLNVTGHWDGPEVVLHTGRISSDIKQHQQAKDNVEGKDFSFGKSRIENPGNTTGKRTMKTEKTVSLQVLRQYFAGSLKDAAKSIGVCPTTLKRICRQHGITRWPSRKIKKVGNSLKKLQVVIDSVEGAKGVAQFSSLYTNFPKTYGSGLTSQNLSESEMRSQLEKTTHPKSSTAKPEGISSGVASLEKSQTSSCSQSSSSSLSCSTAAQPQPHAHLVVNEDALKTQNRSCILKRAYSEAELHSLSKEEETGPLSRSHSHRSLCQHPPSSFPKRVSSPGDCNSVKVKVTYGEDKVRFRLQPSWGYQGLKREIVNRFNMDDASAIDLKYLDDDSEWVLLTSDADVQECKDLYKSSSMHVMKLSAHLVAQPDMRNSLGKTALS